MATAKKSTAATTTSSKARSSTTGPKRSKSPATAAAEAQLERRDVAGRCHRCGLHVQYGSEKLCRECLLDDGVGAGELDEQLLEYETEAQVADHAG